MAVEIVLQLDGGGLEVLYNKRDERAGVKFKDANLFGIPMRIGAGLIGIPVRMGLGPGHLGAPAVEGKLRRESQVDMLPVAGRAPRVREIIGRSG